MTMLLFVCDSLMSGEPGHSLLDGATPRGEATTADRYHLIDLGASGALLQGGQHAVRGELYEVTPQKLAAIDIQRGHPLVHERRPVRLEGEMVADAYFISEDQARGRRRVRNADWRGRDGARHKREPGALVSWAKGRFSR